MKEGERKTLKMEAINHTRIPSPGRQEQIALKISNNRANYGLVHGAERTGSKQRIRRLRARPFYFCHREPDDGFWL